MGLRLLPEASHCQ